MQIKIEDGYKGMKIQRQIYDTVDEIRALLRKNDDFHDGTVEAFGYTRDQSLAVHVHFYDNVNYHFYFADVNRLTFDVDLKVNAVMEISLMETPKNIHVDFEGVGISVDAGALHVEVASVL